MWPKFGTSQMEMVRNLLNYFKSVTEVGHFSTQMTSVYVFQNANIPCLYDVAEVVYLSTTRSIYSASPVLLQQIMDKGPTRGDTGALGLC